MYQLIKIFARLAIRIYCRKIIIDKKQLLASEGPLLLACNHPNSFLDAIILCTLFDEPVYSLARGDAFKNKRVANILYALKLLPVYRVSEGVENLEENYKTFDECKGIFKKNGIVLIFSEGRCINEWHLRPLKKGTARLAMSSWQDGIPLKVLPVGINYQSFKKFGKNVHIHFGELIEEKDIVTTDGYGKSLQNFNGLLQQQLQPLVYEIDKQDKGKLYAAFCVKRSHLKKIILFIPACVGLFIHVPLYLPLKRYVSNKAMSNDHYDSMLVSLVFLSYPFYLLLLSFLAVIILKSFYGLLLLLILPFTAWAYIQLKQQFDQ